jgi:hypothetical protein
MNLQSLRHLTAGCAMLCTTLAASANDFPTVERVLYVQECMKANPGSRYEMTNKCSCALDTLAREVRFEDYSSLVTVVNAMSIGGERGNSLRDNESLKPQVARYRELQAQAYKACFITPR